MPATEFLAPIDMEFGPDGSLYVLEWGGGYDPRTTNQVCTPDRPRRERLHADGTRGSYDPVNATGIGKSGFRTGTGGVATAPPDGSRG